MRASLRALLAESIDYAGTFPPARLPLEEAVRNYARYRTEPDAWMLGRFVCPASRLEEIGPLVDELFASSPPCRFSVVGRGTSSPLPPGEGPGVRAAGEFRDNLQADLEAIRVFEKRRAGRVVIEAIETRLPAEFGSPADVARLATVLSDDAALLAGTPPSRRAVFFETPLPANGMDEVPHILAAFAQTQRPAIGFKLRTGGLEASAFPNSAVVAAVIVGCRDRGIPWKATAGLHHPLGRFDETIGAWTHGFLNVFLAAVLADVHPLDRNVVQTIVEDTRLDSFYFADDALGWKDLRASVEQIADARRRGLISFGSCSFDEPREELRALGLL
jgi:hypothetical protein